MGVEQTIRFAGAVPDWSSVEALLRDSGESPIIRMIDGQPAFPDEQPPPGWKELRVSLSGGMITMRRDAHSVTCVTWGVEDAALERSWRLLCSVWAEADPEKNQG